MGKKINRIFHGERRDYGLELNGIPRMVMWMGNMVIHNQTRTPIFRQNHIGMSIWPEKKMCA